MPEISERREIIPVQPTAPSRGPAQRKGPTRRRDERKDDADHRRPDDDSEHKIDEYA